MVHDIEELLGQLWRLNGRDRMRQAREEGLVSAERIGTLVPGVTLAMSAMLRARYAWADAWHGAAFGQDWPALRNVPALSSRLREQAWHSAHMKALARALPDGVDPARMALLGVDEARGQATYLRWCREQEPLVCAFYGGGVDLFLDLSRYIEFLIGERVHDDSAEILIDPETRRSTEKTELFFVIDQES
ncbi:hypothetical protein [Methylobacterium sp. SyP6R]|uniref:hypothetical protein n=1 Tax=Methylobacterium sp. SyP6R TaxID=2718876 RepID=UPI001F473C20|nr:hypothetical protein [Methylobacterium sp. SyP6R]MCF4130097.1 hypothetical protein [Methylobacterium sp. SyP6R]